MNGKTDTADGGGEQASGDIQEPSIPVSEIEAFIQEMNTTHTFDVRVAQNEWEDGLEQLVEKAKEGFEPADEAIEHLKDRLEDQAQSDRIEVDAMLRRRDVKIGCTDMTSTGLRLWLENNSAVIKTQTDDGQFTVVPEEDHAQ